MGFAEGMSQGLDIGARILDIQQRAKNQVLQERQQQLYEQKLGLEMMRQQVELEQVQLQASEFNANSQNRQVLADEAVRGAKTRNDIDALKLQALPGEQAISQKIGQNNATLSDLDVLEKQKTFSSNVDKTNSANELSTTKNKFDAENILGNKAAMEALGKGTWAKETAKKMGVPDEVLGNLGGLGTWLAAGAVTQIDQSERQLKVKEDDLQVRRQYAATGEQQVLVRQQQLQQQRWAQATKTPEGLMTVAQDPNDPLSEAATHMLRYKSEIVPGEDPKVIATKLWYKITYDPNATEEDVRAYESITSTFGIANPGKINNPPVAGIPESAGQTGTKVESPEEMRARRLAEGFEQLKQNKNRVREVGGVKMRPVDPSKAPGLKAPSTQPAAKSGAVQTLTSDEIYKRRDQLQVGDKIIYKDSKGVDHKIVIDERFLSQFQ